MLAFLLACSNPDAPDVESSLSSMTRPVSAEEIHRAIAIAATHDVEASSSLDLTGTWNIERITFGKGDSMEGPVKRKQERPGVVSIAVVTVYAHEGTPYATIASRGIEVVGTERLCILWLESRLTWSDGSDAAKAKEKFTSIDLMNATPCADSIDAISPTAATFRRGDFVYRETKQP